MNLNRRAYLAGFITMIVLSTIALPAVHAVDASGDRNRDAPPAVTDPTSKILPPGERPGQALWRLGVTVDTLDVGMRIRDVVSRSAAARVGLERDDIIVAVNGYQIGRVGNRVYTLEDELQRRADPRGEVRLLVLDHRTARLVNIDVRLDRAWDRARDVAIRGEVSFRERIALPSDAELRIEVQRRTTFGRNIIARETFRRLGQPPIAFELRYPIENVDPKDRYELKAEIWSRGTRLFVSDRTHTLRPGVDETALRISMRRP